MSSLINPFVFAAAGGGGPLPTDLANLELWLPVTSITGLSDNTAITTWPDMSGNGRDATGQGSGSKPKYRTSGGPTGGPRVEFNPVFGDDFYFSLANFLTAFTAAEAFIVPKVISDPPGLSSVSSHPLGQFGSDVAAAHYPFTDGKIYDDFGSTARKNTDNPVTSLTSYHVYNVRSASGLWERTINAATSGTDFYQTLTNTVGWNTTPQIGKDTNIFQGSIVDIFLFSRILDDATERKPTIHQYLNNAYGFSLPTS